MYLCIFGARLRIICSDAICRVCACCRPEKALRKRTRGTRRWDRKFTKRQANSMDMNRLPMVGSLEAEDRRKSLDISRISSMYIHMHALL